MTTWRVEIGSEATSWDEVVEFLARIFGPNYYDVRFAQQTVLDHEPSRSPGNLFPGAGRRRNLSAWCGSSNGVSASAERP